MGVSVRRKPLNFLYLLQDKINISLSKVTAGELTVLLSTEPVWAAVFSAFALDERMGTGAIIGAFLILSACLVNQADVLPPFVKNSLPVNSTNVKKESTNKSFFTILVTPIASVSTFISSLQDLTNKSPPPS